MLAGAALVASLAVVYALFGSTEEDGLDDTGSAIAIAPTKQQLSPTAEESGRQPSQPALFANQNRPEPSRSMKDDLEHRRESMLARYLREARFPPNSRPLTWSHEDLLNPNQRHEQAKRSEDNPDIRYLLTADRYAVVGPQSLVATLDVWKDDVPLSPAIQAAHIRVVKPELGPLVPITFGLDGERAIARFQPSALLDGPHTLKLQLSVTFDADNEARQSTAINIEYTPSESIPARFTGGFSERVDAGSLLVDAEIEVYRPGYYVVDANLWSNGEPVAWTRFKGELSAASKSLPLEFFGKVLRESGLAGPYLVAQLRGFRFDEARAPDQDRIETAELSHETLPYALEVFSDQDWDSERKRRKIEALQRATLAPPSGMVKPQHQPGSSPVEIE